MGPIHLPISWEEKGKAREAGKVGLAHLATGVAGAQMRISQLLSNPGQQPGRPGPCRCGPAARVRLQLCYQNGWALL